MKNEISSKISYKLFKIKGKSHTFDKDVWQYAPLHWVFAVKHYLGHKTILVMGGHVTDASNYHE